MRRVYDWNAKEQMRTVTVAGMRAEKGTRKWTQVTANDPEEAEAARQAGIDMIACNSVNTGAVRAGDTTRFLTSSLVFPNFDTIDAIIRESFRCMREGADAVMTARSMDVVEALAKEDIPVMGHLGLVPRKSTWTDGLRAVGKTADEAYEVYRSFKRLEDAGGALVEAEVIPGAVMAEITKRTSLIVVSLGSGAGGDVDYLFMEDICGDTETPPRHAREFGNLRKIRAELKDERVRALSAFREAAEAEQFPSEAETPSIEDAEFDRFMERVAREAAL